MSNTRLDIQKVKPEVAVVIPVYNDTVRLKTCLDALASQKTSGVSFTVMVVDNNSTEDIASVTKNYDFVTYLHEPKPGSYHARNCALSALKDEKFIGFTDADCIPVECWIEEAVAALKDNPNAAVGGRIDVFAEDQSSVSTAEYYEILFAFPQQAAIEQENYSVTANLFVTREMIDKAGQFNCDLYSGGDLDYGQKLMKHGFKVRYVDAMAIRHPARATIGQMTSRIRRCAGGSYQQRKAHDYLNNLYSWKGVIYSFRPPIKEYCRILGSKKVPLFMKAKLCLLSSYLRIYRALIYVGYKLKLLTRMERF